MSETISAERLERLIDKRRCIRILTIALAHYLFDETSALTVSERNRVRFSIERRIKKAVRREMVRRLARITVNSEPANEPKLPSENVAVKRVFNGQGQDIFNCISEALAAALGDGGSSEAREYAQRWAAAGMIKFAEEMERNLRTDPSELRLALVG